VSGRPGALASDGRAPSGLLHSSNPLPWKKSHALVTLCVRVLACKNPRRGREETRWRLFVPTDMSPCYKNSPMHTKSKDQEHTHKVLCVLITLLVDLTKSARMHKHANETRAGAGNSDSCSQLNAATDAAAPGRAFPASWQALQALPQCRRQHTELDNTNTPVKEDKARAQYKAPACNAETRHALNARHLRDTACNAGSMRANPCLTPPFPCTACAVAVWMGRTCERSRDGAWCCQGARKQDQG